MFPPWLHPWSPPPSSEGLVQGWAAWLPCPLLYLLPAYPQLTRPRPAEHKAEGITRAPGSAASACTSHDSSPVSSWRVGPVPPHPPGFPFPSFSSQKEGWSGVGMGSPLPQSVPLLELFSIDLAWPRAPPPNTCLIWVTSPGTRGSRDPSQYHPDKGACYKCQVSSPWPKIVF